MWRVNLFASSLVLCYYFSLRSRLQWTFAGAMGTESTASSPHLAFSPVPVLSFPTPSLQKCPDNHRHHP